MDRFIKKWSGIPKSATNVVIHSEQGLDIPTITAVYTEAHNVSHARTRLQGDMNINHVPDHAVERESTYTCNKGTNMQAEEVYQAIIQKNTVGGELPTLSRHQFNRKIRNQVRDTTRGNIQEALSTHAEGIQLQGHLITLAAKEKQDLLWRSSIFQFKAGTLKFMINASIDTLPTPASLRR